MRNDMRWRYIVNSFLDRFYDLHNWMLSPKGNWNRYVYNSMMRGKKSLISWGNGIGVNLDHSSDQIGEIGEINKNCQNRSTGQSLESHRAHSATMPATGVTAPTSRPTQRHSSRHEHRNTRFLDLFHVLVFCAFFWV